MISPLKQSIQVDFRSECGVQSAPAFFNSEVPLTPVVIVAGNVGFPKPRNNQILKTYFFQHVATDADNISIPSSTKKVYFVGVLANVSSGVGGTVNFFIFDSTTKNSRTDADTNILTFRAAPVASTNLTFSDFPPLPVELKSALRVASTVAVSGSAEGVIYYIEEDIGER
jgi:hypothetical protein